MSEKHTDEYVAQLEQQVRAFTAQVRGLESENARLRAALEWATKQLGRAPEMSAALEWCEAHTALIAARAAGEVAP